MTDFFNGKVMVPFLMRNMVIRLFHMVALIPPEIYREAREVPVSTNAIKGAKCH